jgi:hypothetical protein
VPDLVLPPSLAVWDPLGGTPEPLMGAHNGIVVHTMAGSFAGTDNYFHQNGWSGTESTVGVAGSGFCKQWVPWNRQADANLDGNECADYGESFPPSSTASDESPPLTDAQVAKIIDLCVYWCRPESHAACPSTWACRTRGIPARYIATSCEYGIGVHRHGIDPYRAINCPRWSLATGKMCPRAVRLRQVRDVIVPEVVRRLTGIPPVLLEVPVVNPTVVQEPTFGKVCLARPNMTYFWMDSWPSLVAVVDGLEGAGIECEYNGRATAPDGTPNTPQPRGINAVAFGQFDPARLGVDDRDLTVEFAELRSLSNDQLAEFRSLSRDQLAELRALAGPSTST